MTIKVNGEDMGVTPDTTVAQLMHDVGVKPKMTAVQLNDRVLPQNEHATTLLSDGDAIEFIRIVGGG